MQPYLTSVLRIWLIVSKTQVELFPRHIFNEPQFRWNPELGKKSVKSMIRVENSSRKIGFVQSMLERSSTKDLGE